MGKKGGQNSGFVRPKVGDAIESESHLCEEKEHAKNGVDEPSLSDIGQLVRSGWFWEFAEGYARDMPEVY